MPGLVSRQIESAQSRVEGANFDSRRYVVEFDDVVNTQREIIYDERDRILEGVDTRDNLREWTEEVIQDLIAIYCPGRHQAQWDFDGLWARLRYVFPVRTARRRSIWSSWGTAQRRLATPCSRRPNGSTPIKRRVTRQRWFGSPRPN